MLELHSVRILHVYLIGKRITELTKKMIDSVFMVNVISHLYTVKEFFCQKWLKEIADM